MNTMKADLEEPVDDEAGGEETPQRDVAVDFTAQAAAVAGVLGGAAAQRRGARRLPRPPHALFPRLAVARALVDRVDRDDPLAEAHEHGVDDVEEDADAGDGEGQRRALLRRGRGVLGDEDDRGGGLDEGHEAVHVHGGLQGDQKMAFSVKVLGSQCEYFHFSEYIFRY